MLKKGKSITKMETRLETAITEFYHKVGSDQDIVSFTHLNHNTNSASETEGCYTLCWTNHVQQWRIQDFPLGGGVDPLGGGALTFDGENVCKNERFGSRGERVLGTPLFRSANAIWPFALNFANLEKSLVNLED